jgi:glycosyltransferase involved in cell wall biosynthesis
MISIIVPLFNEEESLESFYNELFKFLKELKEDFEIIFVDDGSIDNSLEILKKKAKENSKIKVFSFRRNLGKAEALTYGFIKARGDFIITLDADLQDKPSEIPKLLEKARSGIEVVSGWRKDRKDKSNMKIISRLFNFLISWLFDLHLHDLNCGLKVYTKEAAKSLRLYGGLHRFIPILAYEQGFTVDEVIVEHSPRKYGKSKYGFSKIWKDLPDMFTIAFLVKYGKRPLHFFGIVGGILAFIGILILSYLTILRFMGESIGRRPLLFFGMLLLLAGFQIFFTGFLADLMINISHSKKLLDEETLHYPIKYSNEKRNI